MEVSPDAFLDAPGAEKPLFTRDRKDFAKTLSLQGTSVLQGGRLILLLLGGWVAGFRGSNVRCVKQIKLLSLTQT